jgi:hypothetical protein
MAGARFFAWNVFAFVLVTFSAPLTSGHYGARHGTNQRTHHRRANRGADYRTNRSDRGLELINDDSWWWLKRNSERVFNDAKTAQDRNTEMTLMWNRWRSTLFSWYPNVIAIGPAGSWPLWSVRTFIFYGLSVVLWLSYFYALLRLRRSRASLRDHHPG